MSLAIHILFPAVLSRCRLLPVMSTGPIATRVYTAGLRITKITHPDITIRAAARTGLVGVVRDAEVNFPNTSRAEDAKLRTFYRGVARTDCMAVIDQ